MDGKTFTFSTVFDSYHTSSFVYIFARDVRLSSAPLERDLLCYLFGKNHISNFISHFVRPPCLLVKFICVFYKFLRTVTRSVEGDIFRLVKPLRPLIE